MNELTINENVKIENLIYEVRGVHVMLDSDVSVTKCNGNMVNQYQVVIIILQTRLQNYLDRRNI